MSRFFVINVDCSNLNFWPIHLTLWIIVLSVQKLKVTIAHDNVSHFFWSWIPLACPPRKIQYTHATFWSPSKAHSLSTLVASFVGVVDTTGTFHHSFLWLGLFHGWSCQSVWRIDTIVPLYSISEFRMHAEHIPESMHCATKQFYWRCVL